MKYAALIFGDEHQPKAASAKLSSPEPGQIVRGIDGSVYRVASKFASPDGVVVRLSSLRGEPVQTPPDFRPVGLAAAHFASWLRYHLAYNRDFDLYINSYIEKHNNDHAERAKNIRKALKRVTDKKQRKLLGEELESEMSHQLPYPVGHDGKAFRWADWFQKVVSPKLYVPGRGDAEDKQIIKDELIHEMLFTTLGQRRVLDQFVAKAESFGGGVNKENAAKKLTDFLISSFMYRINEMQNKFQKQNPPEEISMWQPSHDLRNEGEEANILETKEYGVGEEEFQGAEAQKDIAKFREGFRKWLRQTVGEKTGNNFLLMFDIFWRILQTEEDADVKRSDFEQEWIEKTGLRFGSFKDYFTRLPDMIERFIMSHSAELGDKNIFIDLMNVIRSERTQREYYQRERARPAMVSSLNIAGVEQDYAEARQAHHHERIECKCGNVRTCRCSEPKTTTYVESCPACSMKTAEYTQEDWERDEAAQYWLDSVEEAKKWEGEGDEEEEGAEKTAANPANPAERDWKPGEWFNRDRVKNCPKCGSPDVDRSVTLGDKERCNECKHEWTSASGEERIRREELLKSVRPGDRVTIWIPAGTGRGGQEWTEATGRAVIVSPDRVALNMGGAHGTPGVATVENIVSVRKAKQSSTGLECQFIEYKPGVWYYLLENWDSPKGGWDWRESATAYGPFPTWEEGREHLHENHANPGGSSRITNAELRPDEVLDNAIAHAQNPKKSLRASMKTAQKLVRGDQLAPDEIKQVKDAFIYRWTSDNERRGDVYHCDKCDVQKDPYVNTTSAEGHQHPTIPLQTDEQWLREHAFYFTNAGKLLPRRHAVPAYLAPEQLPVAASLAHKFAMEKAAYNPGKGQYIYQAEPYCEMCGEAIREKLDAAGEAPEKPSDEYSYDSDYYPKGPYFDQESDAPEHCARCGVFLENPLTTEGYRYLNSMITEAEDTGAGNDEVIEEWKAFYPEREEYMGIGIHAKKKAALSNRGWFWVTHNGNDFQCPHCGAGLTDEEWNTDDGERLSGEWEVECPDCGKPFIVDIAVETRYRTQPKKAVYKKAMIPHEFDNADGQAIRNETYPDTAYVSGEADTAEFRERRQAADEAHSVAKTILEQLGGRRFIAMTGARNFIDTGNGLSFRLPGSGGFIKNGINVVRIDLTPNDTYNVTFSRLRGSKDTVISKHDDVYADSLREVFESETGLATSLGTMGKSGAIPSNERWKCMDCGNVGKLNREGRCGACGSEAVHPEALDNQQPALPAGPTEGVSTIRETKPVEVERRMVPIRERRISPNPDPKIGKTAQGGGNTTVTMQEQNVTDPNVPSKGQPIAVPNAIDQIPGPHSSNAPATAPRSPGIQPRIVNVPSGTEGETGMSSTASIEDPEEITCPRCHGTNIDVDAVGSEGYKIYCEDCEQVTYEGRLVPGRPARDYRETPGNPPGDEWSMLERMGRIEGEIEPDFELDRDADAAREDERSKTSAEEDGGFPISYEVERKGKVLPFSTFIDAIRKMKEGERVYGVYSDGQRQYLGDMVNGHFADKTRLFDKDAAGSNSGNDDVRGAGDLWRENFYEHRTEGLSTDGMLSGMKDAAGAAPAAVHPNVQQNLNLVRPQEQAPGPGGSTVAIIPGEGQEEPGGERRHTIEPELPNAKYHMMGALIASEEERLAREAGLDG
jgi:hypothetical protein